MWVRPQVTGSAMAVTSIVPKCFPLITRAHSEMCNCPYFFQHRFGITICLADLLLYMRTVVHLLLRIMVCMCMAVTTSCQYNLVNSENAERAVAHVGSNRIIYARPSPVQLRAFRIAGLSKCECVVTLL